MVIVDRNALTDTEWLELWGKVEAFAHMQSRKHHKTNRELFLEISQINILESIRKAPRGKEVQWSMNAIAYTHSTLVRMNTKAERLRYYGSSEALEALL